MTRMETVRVEKRVLCTSKRKESVEVCSYSKWLSKISVRSSAVSRLVSVHIGLAH